MSYELVEDLQKKAITVSHACCVLEVSRSGYYAHLAAHKQRLAAPVVCAANVHLKAAFAASQKAYGSRRLRTATACDTPTTSAALSLVIPVAICCQNCRSTPRRSDGAPGERIAPRPVNFCIHPAGRPINTSLDKGVATTG